MKTTLNKALLTLSLLALPLIALPGLAEARRATPKYGKTAINFRAQQSHRLRNKVQNQRFRQDARYQQRLTQRNQLKKTTKTVKPVVKTLSKSIKNSTTRAYISRSLHKQASLNYFANKLGGVRVTKVQLDDNKSMFKNGSKYTSWTAKVKMKDGSSYNARGFIRQDRAGQPKGVSRVKIVSGTPAFGISIK